MDDSHIFNIAQIKEFLKLNNSIKFKSLSRKGKYQWIEKALTKFKYFRQRKRDKTIVKNYICQMTGLSDARLTKLITRKKRSGLLWLGSTKRHRFPRKYTPTDIAKLIETDNLHYRLSGPATKKILKREYEVFGKAEYQNISNISPSHIYNLRSTRQYQSQTLTIKKTNPVKIPIGERRKPEPQGKPGYLRVDSVHQGDLEKEKGVYHINIVDEITQWEILGCVERISEYFLAPLLEDLINQYPFVILGFHSDNGSEFINKVVAQLLNKLLIKQTKSRARHSNDNALVEGKNGSIIRKHIGYQHIPRKYAQVINQFYKEYLNVYLNYHRPCGFATIKVDKKGKEKKVYNVYLTPYEALKSHPDALNFLKKGISFEKLDKIAYTMSDNELAGLMQKAKEELFNNFNRHKLQFPTIFTTFISGSYVD
jgi:transposase InsO family protein